MWTIILLSILPTILSLPLQLNSFITLRTVSAPKAGGGNAPPPPPYGPLILEEWNASGFVQEWKPSCTLPGLSTETWTEGHLSPRYPWGDQVWFLCRNVPANASLATNPAPVVYSYLTEDGILNSWAEEPLYPNGTNALNILPYWDEAQSLNVFYLLGGGTTAANGPTSPAKPAQARIRVDTGPGQPPDTQGALLLTSTGVTINQLRILNKTLYGTGLFGGSTGIPNPTIFQIGPEGILPTGSRNPSTQIPNFPLVLSVWTDPFSSVWWRTGLNKTAYLARHNNTDGSDLVFPLPPSASAGTLGGVSWSVATARQEDSDFVIYLTNSTHIVKNTLNGLQNGLPYQSFLQAPPGWRYLSAHARNPSASTAPSPSPTSTSTASSSATSTASTSSTSTASSSATVSATATSTASPSATSCPTSTSSSSASASASGYPSSTATASRDPAISSSITSTNTPSTTPSNGTLPVPPDNSQTDADVLSPETKAGIGLGTIGAICVAGLILMQYSPAMKNLYVQKFGSSSKAMKKGVSFRSPVTNTDVPITISHNPAVMMQQRLEQLKDLQKQMSIKQVNQETTQHSMEKTKKEFLPQTTKEEV